MSILDEMRLVLNAQVENPPMTYRKLGNTGLEVSEIGYGGEWLSADPDKYEEGRACLMHAQECGINIVDCWMADPGIRSNLGNALKGNREKWIIQGHIGSTWKDGQYFRTRDMEYVKPAFEDLLERLQTDYIDLGMIHYVDDEADWNICTSGPFWNYVEELKTAGTIKHVGLSTHNPKIAKLAVESGKIEMLMFSINPAFDMLPASEDINTLFAEEYDPELGGINRERANLYKLCEVRGIGITVMKPFAGGRLFDAAKSPFGVGLTPIQCAHYALTRPAVASIMGGYKTIEEIDGLVAYEAANPAQKDYASVLANAPKHSYMGQCTYCGHCKPCARHVDVAMVNKFYDLAIMQASTKEEVPESLREHYAALDKHASDCVLCHACEPRCPFGVKIVDCMMDAHELFGF